MAKPNVKPIIKPKKTVKLTSYLYEGTDSRGAKVKGEILAETISLAKTNIRRQGLTPLKVKRKPYALFSKTSKKRIKAADIAAFSRQMATMLSAGVPLVQSLEIVTKGVENPSMQELVATIKGDVESGKSFSDSLRAQSKHFDELFCNLVGAGEASGSLEQMLGRIATYKEKSESLKKKIKKALFYPTAVMVVAIIVTGILLVFVVPQFQQLFKGFGADLPAFTLLVIHLSEITQKWWWAIIIGFIGMGSGMAYMKRKSASFRLALDSILIKLPIVGTILEKAAVARYARTLSTTFAAGVPLVEALDSVAGATGNLVFSNAVKKIREEVTTGTQLQNAMRNTGIFPNMVVQMVAIGEESGALDAMLDKVATIYEEEVDNAVDSLSSLLEPIIMAVLGVLVGGLVIAMYLPIFKMGSVV